MHTSKPVLLIGLILSAACGTREPAAPSKLEPAPVAAAPTSAPRFQFVAPEAWRPHRGGAAPVEPPDLDQETWRVLVTQNKPLQVKTPLWQPLPARETVEVAMPERSPFECIVAPLEVSAESNDFGSKLESWQLTRTFYCSADGWHSWTEHPHRDSLAADGTRQNGLETGLLMRVRDGDEVMQSFVLLRSDKEHREATTGPPKLVPGNAGVD